MDPNLDATLESTLDPTLEREDAGALPVRIDPRPATSDAPMGAVIDAWFVKHFHGLGPKLDTELYNLIHAAKDDLKRILRVDSPAASEAE